MNKKNLRAGRQPIDGERLKKQTSNIYNKNSITDYCKVQDVVTGKMTDKKKMNLYLSEIYKSLRMENKSWRVKECGTWLEFSHVQSDWKLSNANFCKARLCPTCNWRRSLKIFGQVSRISDKLKSDGFQFLFLTLTVPNCSADDLDQTIRQMNKAFRNFREKKQFKNAFDGWFRALEVTINSKTNTYHPHYHIILAVTPKYFKGDIYLSQKKITEIWKSSLKSDFVPICHIEKIKSKHGDDISKAVAEIAKYTVKDSDYLTGNKIKDTKRVWTLEQALSGKRLIAMGGVFKDTHKLLNLDDPLNGNLCNEINNDVADVILKFKWHGTGYVRY